MINHYQNLKDISPKGSRNSSSDSSAAAIRMQAKKNLKKLKKNY
jgi:hypothetical protein